MQLEQALKSVLLLLHFQSIPMVSWNALYNKLTEEEKTQAWFIDGSV